MKEKRQYTRAPVRVEIICDELKDEQRRGEAVLCFYSTDISLGGVFLETSVPFKVGDTLHIRFVLPRVDKSIITIGKVVRLGQSGAGSVPGIGIEFERLNFDDKKLIEGYVVDEIADQL